MTRNGVYTKSSCAVPGCPKRVTNSGRGYVAHMRMHVRRGEAKESKVYYGKYDYGYQYEPIIEESHSASQVRAGRSL